MQVRFLPGLPGYSRLIAIQILFGHIVFWHFMSVDFLLVRVIGALYTRYNIGLKRIPFLNKFAHTLRIGFFASRQSLQVS